VTETAVRPQDRAEAVCGGAGKNSYVKYTVPEDVKKPLGSGFSERIVMQ